MKEIEKIRKYRNTRYGPNIVAIQKRKWYTMLEAFNIIGSRVFLDRWTGDEIKYIQSYPDIETIKKIALQCLKKIKKDRIIDLYPRHYYRRGNKKLIQEHFVLMMGRIGHAENFPEMKLLLTYFTSVKSFLTKLNNPKSINDATYIEESKKHNRYKIILEIFKKIIPTLDVDMRNIVGVQGEFIENYKSNKTLFIKAIHNFYLDFDASVIFNYPLKAQLRIPKQQLNNTLIILYHDKIST